jgi:hypothetical protein
MHIKSIHSEPESNPSVEVFVLEKSDPKTIALNQAGEPAD